MEDEELQLEEQRAMDWYDEDVEKIGHEMYEYIINCFKFGIPAGEEDWFIEVFEVFNSGSKIRLETITKISDDPKWAMALEMLRKQELLLFGIKALRECGDSVGQAISAFATEAWTSSPRLEISELERILGHALLFHDTAFVMGWNRVKPLDAVSPPPFPYKCYPAPIANMVEAVAADTQTPAEMAGILMLGVLATPQQGKNKVQVKAGYSEQLSIFAVAVAPPGERKSSVIKSLTEPLTAYETERNRERAVEIEMNKFQKKALETQLKNLERRALTNNLDPEARTEFEDLTQELFAFKEAHPLRLFVSNVTPEKLIDIWAQQGGKLTICSAEGNTFDALAAPNERGTTLIEPLLKGHAGDTLTVDRMSRESNIIDNPHLSMILTVQPHVINSVMKNREFSGRGLLARFLFVKCSSYIGTRSAISPEIPDSVKSEYRKLIFDLLDTDSERTFLLSPDAEKERQRFYDIIEKRLAGEWNFMREFGSKFMGTTIRIAGLIHGAENQDTDYISGDVFRRAIEIAECLGKHAELFYLTAGANEVIEDAKYILARLKSADYKTPLAKSEFQSLCQRFKTVAELEKPLELLIQHRYLKRIKDETGRKGRPGEKIEINPYWIEHELQGLNGFTE